MKTKKASKTYCLEVKLTKNQKNQVKLSQYRELHIAIEIKIKIKKNVLA